MATSVGDRITALAAAGTLYLSSNQKVILTRLGCGSILSILPTGTPLIRMSSPTNMPLLLSKYATTWVRFVSSAARAAASDPPAVRLTKVTARAIRMVREFIIVRLLGAGNRSGSAVAALAARVEGHQAQVAVAVRGRGTEHRQGSR